MARKPKRKTVQVNVRLFEDNVIYLRDFSRINLSSLHGIIRALVDAGVQKLKADRSKRALIE